MPLIHRILTPQPELDPARQRFTNTALRAMIVPLLIARPRIREE